MKIASKILSTIIIVLLIAAIVLFTLPRLFGIGLYVVVSGSMAPKYQVGDIVYAFPTKAKDIKEEDVITYMISDETFATHRVTKIVPVDSPTDDPQDGYWFYTKGDANGSADGQPTIYKNVVGVVRFSLPKVGKLLEFVQKPQGMIISGTIVLAIILLSAIFSLGSREEDKKDRKAYKKGRKQEEIGERPAFDRKNFGRIENTKAHAVPEPPKRSAKPVADGKRVPPPGWGSGKR